MAGEKVITLYSEAGGQNSTQETPEDVKKVLDEKADKVKKLQEELKHRTDVEKEAERLICEGEHEAAVELLKSLDDSVVRKLGGETAVEKEIPLYNEAGELRTIWEVLKDVKEAFEKPVESYMVEISEEQIEKAEFVEDEMAGAGKNFLWCIERENNSVKIHPMNNDSITIHGEDELWFFICCLLD